MSYLALGLIAAFAAVLIAALTLSSVAVQRQRVNRQLRQIETWDLSGGDLRARELAVPLPTRVVIPALRRLGKRIRSFTPAGVIERLTTDLELAGSPESWDAERVLAAKVITAGLFGPGVLGIGLLAGLGIRAFVLAVFAGFVGYYVPEWLLRARISSRQEQIQRSLPDSLDLLTITVEAGLGFDAALSRVTTQVPGPLAEEYHRVLTEMQLGKSRADALRDLGDRTTVSELKNFVLAMIQADTFGVSIANVLRVQSEEMRIKRRQRAEEAAHKVPIKILFPLISCVFPSLFIVLLGPAAIRIADTLL